MTIGPASKGVLIGGGYFAQFHAEAWQRIPTVEIVAVADSSPDKAPEFARQYGIPRAYTSVEEMVEREQPDFVDIVTGPESHLNLTRVAAARGIHVICQKPMAPSWEECTAMGTFCVEGDRSRLRMSEDSRLWFTEYGGTETPHDYPIPNRGYKGDSVWALRQHLIDSLRSGQRSESDGRDYLATMRAVFACYRSAETFETVILD